MRRRWGEREWGNGVGYWPRCSVGGAGEPEWLARDLEQQLGRKDLSGDREALMSWALPFTVDNLINQLQELSTEVLTFVQAFTGLPCFIYHWLTNPLAVSGSEFGSRYFICSTYSEQNTRTLALVLIPLILLPDGCIPTVEAPQFFYFPRSAITCFSVHRY